MILRVIHKGFNYSQDGPGNRLVYHLQGCNMHCPWCANPESTNPEGFLIDDPATGTHISFTSQKTEDLLEEANDSRPLFFDGGGVTTFSAKMEYMKTLPFALFSRKVIDSSSPFK